MKAIHFLLLLSWVPIMAQEDPSATPSPNQEERPADANTEAPRVRAPSVPARGNASAPPRNSSFQDRLSAILKGNNNPAEEVLAHNYQIKIESLINSNRVTISIVTAKSTFTHQGVGKGSVIDGNTVPSTSEIRGALRDETEEGIFLDYFIGWTVPFVTGTYSSGGRVGSTSQYQQIRVGSENGARFTFGKPLKVMESDQEEITITITRLESQ